MDYDSLGLPTSRYGYRFGRKSGAFEIYYPNGKVKENGMYRANILHGKYKMFYDNGMVKEEGEYQEGKKMGKWFLYETNGKKTKQVFD
jgi:antitoxin component YwqK of YwqJK toxin-antitoxin module